MNSIQVGRVALSSNTVILLSSVKLVLHEITIRLSKHTEESPPFNIELSCERVAIYSVGYIMLYSMAIALRGLSCAEA